MAARPASTISRKHKSGDQVDLLALIRMQNALVGLCGGLASAAVSARRSRLSKADYAERFKSGGVK